MISSLFISMPQRRGSRKNKTYNLKENHARKVHAPARPFRGIEPEHCLWQMKRWRRAVQRSKSEMRRHRVFGNRKREGDSEPPRFWYFWLPKVHSPSRLRLNSLQRLATYKKNFRYSLTLISAIAK